MIQTLWFFIKITFVIGLLIAVARLPGEMTLGFFDYTVTIATGVFLLLVGLLSLCVYILIKALRSLFLIPRKIVARHEETRHQKGFSALTRGLVAVAAGDSKKASLYAKRAQSMLPNNQIGLQLLLEAQAAKMRGEDGLAQNRFEALMSDKDAAFLGIRGLLKSAIDNNNHLLALDYAEKAAKLHPEQTWVLQTLYYLQVQNKLWGDVLETGKKALKISALERDKVESDQIAIHLMRYDYEVKQGNPSKALNDLKKAYKIDSSFAPTIVRYVGYHLAQKKKRQAINLIKKSWKESPHTDIALLWESLAPKGNQSKVLAWYHQLIDLNSDSVESYIVHARASIDLELWGEAKSSLVNAERIKPSARIYHLLAIVEQNSTHNDNAIHELMEKASDAMPDKAWVCSQTGIIYEEWTPIAAPHGSFNTVVWQYPGQDLTRSANPVGIANDSALLIDPAA